jgi:TonB family protein
MRRDATIPLFLWICAAFCAHLFFAGGGAVVTAIHLDRSLIRGLARDVRDRIRSVEQTFEVSAFDDAPKAAEPPPESPEDLAVKPKEPEPKKEEPKKPEPKPEPKKPEPKKPEPPPVVVEEKKEEEKKPEPLLQDDKRIAVRQHAKDNQPDNPKANFIGDQANHVEEETVATQTSHDQDDPNPTPGGNHAGDPSRVGDSERTRIADSDDRPGEKNRAPGEKGTDFDVITPPTTTTPPKEPVAVTPPTPANAGGDGKTAQVPNPTAAPPAPPEPPVGGAGPAAPETMQADNGNWSFNPVRPGARIGAPNEAAPGTNPKRAQNPAAQAGPTLGLGARTAPGQVNLNLQHEHVVAIVGQDNLRKMREADGERRKSEHRGSWTASSFERWRSAIENYVSSVKPGNQTALNTAASPFATYLNGMHNRIHPIFADTFLGSLEALPKTHPLNEPRLLTKLEIILTREGHLVKMGIVRTSGVTAFDIAALDSVQRASPFGPAPSAIISADGNVYLHWEFHRNEVLACSTMNARPFLLTTPPKEPPSEPSTPPPGPGPTRERSFPESTRETRSGSGAPFAPFGRM